MRSAGLASRAFARDSDRKLTEAENSFRNAKLRQLPLVVYKSLADVAAKGSFFIVTLVAARRLSPWAFGVFGLGTTVGWMLAVVTDFGMQMHLARAVAREPQAGAALLRRWWRRRVLATAAGLASLAAFLVLAGVSRETAVPLFLIAVVYGVSGLVEFVNYFYRGLSRTDIESTLTIWQRIGALACALAALAWRPDVSVLAVALLLPAAASLVWSVRRATDMGASDPLSARDSFSSDVFPIGLGIVLSAIYFRVDVLLVQLWVGTEAVGGYNAVFRLVDALRLFPAAVLAVVFPSLCRTDTFRPLAEASALVTAFAAAAAMVIWLQAESIVTLFFGARYLAAAPALRVLGLTLPLLSLNLALTHQVVGWNQQRAYAAICAAALAVNLGLNAWLIPAYAIDGAAWATLGTEVCVTGGCLVALRGRA